MTMLIGDIIRLKNGNAPLILTKLSPSSRSLYYVYLSDYSGGYFSKHSLAEFAAPQHFSSAESYGLREKMRTAEDFVPFDWAEVKEKHQHLQFYADRILIKMGRQPMAQKLYQTKEETPRFGTMLTTNSKGQFVLEMKGKDGAIECFNKDEIEEVMPYTVQISNGEGTKHMEITKDRVSLNDLLMDLSTLTIFRVVLLDTKSRGAIPCPTNLIKLLTEPLSDGK